MDKSTLTEEQMGELIVMLRRGFAKGYVRAVTGLEGEELEQATDRCMILSKDLADGFKKRGTVRGCYRVETS